MNLDILTNILLKTNMLDPFYLVSKDYNEAFKQAVSILIQEMKPIVVMIKNKKIIIRLEYNSGWGIRIKTKKAFRFFSRDDVIKNNLWVEGPLIISIKNNIRIQYMSGDYIYVKNATIPYEIKKIFF